MGIQLAYQKIPISTETPEHVRYNNQIQLVSRLIVCTYVDDG